MQVTAVMIVKNEAGTIRQTLEALAPFVDRVVILDTGSSDGTRAVVEDWHRAYSDCRHLVYRTGEISPWNFSVARNKVLEIAAEQSGGWCLTVDAENVVSGDPAKFRAWIETLPEHANCADVAITHGDLAYTQPRLTRNGGPCRYVGPVHETLDTIPSHRAEGISIHLLPGDNARRLQRMRDHDIPALLDLAYKGDPRSTFYLAQSYFDLGDLSRASDWYSRRAAMKGTWEEERFEAQLRYAELAKVDIADAYLAAHEMRPWRAEPLHLLALHYCRQSEWALCYTFAWAAAMKDGPKGDRLFVRTGSYGWAVWDLIAISAQFVRGEFQRGYLAAQRALDGCPEDQRPRLEANWAWYQSEGAKGRTE